MDLNATPIVLKIDPEFRDLIPPLTDQEIYLLEISIIEEGVRDPLVVWDDTILDGHHRYDICRKINLPFNVVQARDIRDREDAKVWIIRNQLSRRNLTPQAYAYMIGLQYRVEKQPHGGDRKSSGKNYHLIGGKSAGKIAEEYGIEEKTVRNAEEFADAVDTLAAIHGADLKTRVLTGKVKATRENIIYLTGQPEADQRRLVDHLLAGKKFQDARAQVVRDRLKDAPPLQEGKYRVIYADPPWQYGKSLDPATNLEADKHYPTMPLDEICSLPVKDLADENAVLFLWSTSPMVPEALQVIEAWGFTYKASYVWDKVRHVYGHYNSVRHEFLLVATRGSCLPETPDLFDSVISIERQGHSRKPEKFREIIETLYPSGKRIELFARGRYEGWDVWGNQANEIPSSMSNCFKKVNSS